MGLHNVEDNVRHIENTIEINGIKYVRADSIVSTNTQSMDLGDVIALGIAKGLAPFLQNMAVGNQQQLPEPVSPEPTPNGFDKLPEQKKGNELSSILFSKLPKGKKHGSRFRSFYTDFERDTGIGLYEFYKKRIASLGNVDISQYPHRKSDAIFMIADDETVFKYAKNYEFNFGK